MTKTTKGVAKLKETITRKGTTKTGKKVAIQRRITKKRTTKTKKRAPI